MLNFPPGVRIYAFATPCDMRKQIDGLAALVQHQLGHDAQSGHLFLAFNRRGDMVRLLIWDTNGFCLVTKRLERGRFRLPWYGTEATGALELDATELGRILEGVVLRKARAREPGQSSNSRAA